MYKWIIPLLLAICLASCQNVMTTVEGVNLPVTCAKTFHKQVKKPVKKVDNPQDHTQEKTFWTKNTYYWQYKLVKLGYKKTLANYVINKCKYNSKNPEHCIITAGFIGYAESTAGQSAFKNNAWGINEGKAYNSLGENFDRWLKSYTKYWYKTK